MKSLHNTLCISCISRLQSTDQLRTTFELLTGLAGNNAKAATKGNNSNSQSSNNMADLGATEAPTLLTSHVLRFAEAAKTKSAASTSGKSGKDAKEPAAEPGIDRSAHE
jgi:hypothetical protein